MTPSALADRLAWQQAYVRTFPKGKVLSHLLGIIIASQFVVGGASHYSIPYPQLPLNTAWLDLPLRLLAVWLILDRNWRIGRLKFTAWDAIALGFSVLVGLMYPFTLADPSLGADADGYKAFLGDMLRFYTVFILVREAHLRAGFNARILLTWVMLGLAFSAGLAVLQAFDWHGMRRWSEQFFDQERSLNSKDAYRARGTARHWNGFASQMVIGVLIAASGIQWRRLKWWEVALGCLFVVGLVVSTSRGGYVTLFVAAVALGIFFAATRRYRTGGVILGGLAFSLLAFVAIVVSFDIPRFKNLVNPPKVESKDIGSLTYRLKQGERLMRVGMEHPITGTGPSQALYNYEHYNFYSTSSVPGNRDITYPLLFAEFGIVGIVYMVALIGFFVRFIGKRNARHPYALLAFGTGVALAVHSFSEMLLLSDLMYLVSIVAALAVSNYIPVNLPGRYGYARARQMPKAPEPERAYVA